MALALATLGRTPSISWASGCPTLPEIAQGAASVGAAPAVAEIAPAIRLRFIADTLRRGAAPARTWTWGWGVGLSTVGAAQFVAAPLVSDRGQRAELLLGGSKSVLGLFPILVTPLTVMGDARRLDERLAAAGASANECESGLLAEAERMLVAAAWRENFGKSWLQHTGVFVVNLGAGLALGLGYGRWTTGALGAAVGIAVGETIIYTQPRQSVDALGRYRAGTLDAPPATTNCWFVVPTVDTRYAGATVVTMF
jgi:hypothetical protein